MRHADFVARFDPPVASPDAPRPTLEWSRRGVGRARSVSGRLRRRLSGRRVAYIDSHFPWRERGFAYADALALHRARPDTVFFSMYEMTDPFPAPVLPLARFPRVAPQLGVTDVYGAFPGFMAGVLGLRGGEPDAVEGLNLSGFCRRERMRVHVGLYPDAGHTGAFDVRGLLDAADQVFSWSPAVLERFPEVTPIAPAIVDTAFYGLTPRDFGARPLQLLLAADDPDVVPAALEALADEPVHLHVVGSHQGVPGRATPHGRLAPEALRDLYARCHVFLSPAPDSFSIAAGEAASSGCLLIGSIPHHRMLRPGVDHVETTDMAGAIRWVMEDPDGAGAIARSGSRRVRERLDVRNGVADRLSLMGVGPPPASRDAAVLDDMAAEIRSLGGAVKQLREELGETRRTLLAVGQLTFDDEAATRRLLDAARREPGYDDPFSEPTPLVSICIPTYTRHDTLIERAIPSALAQDHPEIEIVVVGDTAPPETAEGIDRLADPRVRYENLNVRGPYPGDAVLRWYVAGTAPLNRAMALARGAWIAILNDDDALRPNHVSTLLEAARASRSEVAYGQLVQHAPDGDSRVIGTFPPERGGFGWQLALQHRSMRLFEYELASALFDEPGDWNRARRMLRAGVRFHMVDEVVCDYYPSLLWDRR